MCSSIVRTAAARDVPVTTLQQGVVSHTIDVPVHADRYICFGDASARTLRDLDRAISKKIGQSPRRTDYVQAGSLFDPVSVHPPAPEAGRLLVIGQFTDWAVRYYGIDAERTALYHLLRRLLDDVDGLKQMIIRPHPAGGSWEDWSALSNEYPNGVELSSPYANSIAYDIERCTAASGLFSGALVTAAACGRPVFFLSHPESYWTPDLTPFANQSGSADPLFERISLLLRSPDAYRTERRQCMHAAHAYYKEGTACSFDDTFFERLLRFDAPPARSSAFDTPPT
jgi:hypothetical protein